MRIFIADKSVVETGGRPLEPPAHLHPREFEAYMATLYARGTDFITLNPFLLNFAKPADVYWLEDETQLIGHSEYRAWSKVMLPGEFWSCIKK